MKKPIWIKLCLVIGILLSLILVVGLTAFYQTTTINDKVTKIVDVEHKNSETAYQIKINVKECGISLHKYVHDNSPTQVPNVKVSAEKFQKFQKEYHSLSQTAQIKILGNKTVKSYEQFNELATNMVKNHDEQLLLIDSCKISFTKINKFIDAEMYNPVKRFDAHKDLKMRAALKVQEMKVDINQLESDLENYLITPTNEFEIAIDFDQTEFLKNFNSQQLVARPGSKEKFGFIIKNEFNKATLLVKSIISAETQKQIALKKFEDLNVVLSALIEEQTLIIANKNLIESKEDALQTAKKSNVIILILMIITTLFGIITGVIFTRSITKPLKQLVKATEVIAESDFSQKVEIKSNDEFEVLGNSFNQMTDHLQVAQTEQAALLLKIEKSNKELEDFAHVVSHDLKAPLRGISSLSEWLSADYADKLGPEGVEQLNLLKSRVKRMFDMIDGILKYSKVGRVEERKEMLNLNEFVESTVQFLAVPANFKIKIQENLPIVTFDRIRLQQVFQNLISNAVKYNDKEHGLIQINCLDKGDFWQFGVSDNGKGIESQNLHKIFKLFQTIQPIDDRESTGVGLAIVQKIIEEVGGKIWVESIIGEGSTFNFTLPKSIKN